MFAGEAVFHLGLLELQLGNQGFQGYDLIEYSFGFDSDVYGASTALVGIQLTFGLLKLFAHIRQLAAQKVQALCGFGGVTLDVLQYVEAVDLIQYLVGQIGIFAFQRQCDDAGFLATFSGRHIFLVLQNGV
ncbi:hypothetical protein D3C84_837140 [compost metagenome]